MMAIAVVVRVGVFCGGEAEKKNCGETGNKLSC